jgi:medium-chain acyl-[acyl-carrier-protein] hydrolase
MRLPETQAHQRHYTIRSYEVDASGRLSVPSVFNLLQDAASSHAFELGVSVSQLLSDNYTWVLSRIFLTMSHYPVWRDAVRIRTWPSGIHGAFAFRDFDIRDETDRSMGCARSAWIVMDAGKRRPVRPTVFADRLKAAEEAPIISHALNKLPEPSGDYVKKRFNVRYSDLDINQHVNNVSYIEWLLESIPDFGKKQRHLLELEINFLGEAFQGDQVLAGCIASQQHRNVFLHSITRQGDLQPLIRARTLWQ